jgi:predicted PurR-regulated permease PerM
MFRSVGLPELLVIAIFFVIFLWPWARIFSKAGYSRWMCLIFIVPIVNVFVLFWFAFAEWPVLKRLRQHPTENQPIAPL